MAKHKRICKMCKSHFETRNPNEITCCDECAELNKQSYKPGFNIIKARIWCKTKRELKEKKKNLLRMCGGVIRDKQISKELI